jgi:hypothetical protein
MATRKSARPATKSLARSAVPTRRKAVPARSRAPAFPIRTIAVVIGVAGLCALGAAAFGSRRFRDDVIRPFSAATLLPVAAAIAPQADRVWAETKPWREHVGRVLSSINTEEVRDQIAQRLTHWIDRFR